MLLHTTPTYTVRTEAYPAKGEGGVFVGNGCGSCMKVYEGL